jgi:hypothetical protein
MGRLLDGRIRPGCRCLASGSLALGGFLPKHDRRKVVYAFQKLSLKYQTQTALVFPLITLSIILLPPYSSSEYSVCGPIVKSSVDYNGYPAITVDIYDHLLSDFVVQPTFMKSL